jgi:hypothetical protein
MCKNEPLRSNRCLEGADRSMSSYLDKLLHTHIPEKKELKNP